MNRFIALAVLGVISVFATPSISDAGHVDGMSLYRAYFVPGGVDPSGEETYVIDGTGADDNDGSNNDGRGGHTASYEFYRRSQEQGGYLAGVGTRGDTSSNLTGFGHYDLVLQTKKDVCESFCAAKHKCQLKAEYPRAMYKEECKIPEFDLIGWSRGAVGVVTVARLLNDEGCDCWLCINGSTQQMNFKPIPVRFLGLYDAVSQHFFTGDTFETQQIPSNVKFSAALWRTGAFDAFAPAFPQAKYSGLSVEKDFYLWKTVVRRGWDLKLYNSLERRKTTHADAGRHQNAAEWMIRTASGAGVPVQ